MAALWFVVVVVEWSSVILGGEGKTNVCVPHLSNRKRGGGAFNAEISMKSFFEYP